MSDTLAVVAGAEVELLPGARKTRADDSGRFVFEHVPPGTYELRARRLGFEPATRQVVIASQTVFTGVNVRMRKSAQPLKEVVIEGRTVAVPPRFEAVYERAARGWGKLFTRQDIYDRNPSDLKSLLATLPAVHVNDRGITFQRCQSDLNHLSAAMSGQARAKPGQARRPGNVQVWVDGHRLTWTTNDPTADADAQRVLAQIHPSDVEAMEVYTGVARLPAEFMDDACAAIVIWTKAW